MPDEAPEAVAWRIAEPSEIPGGAKTVANAARKNGWEVRIGFARGPWMTDADDDEPAEDAVVKVCEMVSVQGRRDTRGFQAVWHRKLWTKPGQEGTYTFAGASISPPVVGEVVASKAKKDRSAEHLGDKTVGGLKNSKTLNIYLKES